MFANKKILITGGTGSFGYSMIKRVLDEPFDEIRVFSRDEKKQDDMRKELQVENVSYHIGDVRDYRSVKDATRGVDFVFHAAALKQVPSCEFHPLQAVQTNVLGTENVLDAAIENNVAKVVCLSTDKAVYPINAMGISKAMMEKIAVAKARLSNNTIICCTRYGNVLASRGSVVPMFVEQVKSGRPLTITNPSMTRFLMTLEDAIELVLFAFANVRAGEICVQKSPAATIDTLAKAVGVLCGCDHYPTIEIGTRHGEKVYETLLSREEFAMAEEYEKYYVVKSDDRDLNYEKFTSEGIKSLSEEQEYNSHNTTRLSVSETVELLSKIKDTLLIDEKV